jgi:hypothetical protein
MQAMGKQSIAVAMAFLGWFGACSTKSGSQESPDGNLEPTGAPVACQDNPKEGDLCDPLPEGLYCRKNSCVGGCENECRCQQGKWNCAVRCVDSFSPVPVDCGTPPLCREMCQWATVLPDGGLAFPTDGSYSSGIRVPVSFSPPDMSTLWGDKELKVTVPSQAVERSWMPDLAGRLSICTWPEQETVPATSTVVASSSQPVLSVSLVPSSKLTDRWYGLRISALPFWMSPPATHVAPDGTYISRFRTGSEPRITSLRFAGGASKHRLYIATSELVSAQQSPASFVQVQSAGSSVTCSDVDFVAGRATPTLGFDCPMLSVFPDQVIVGAGLLSTTGVALAPVTIAKPDLTLDSSCGADCQTGGLP